MPITVCGTYYTYLSQAILPLRPNPVDDNWLHAALLEQGIVFMGAAEEALEVHIHPQISSDGGRRRSSRAHARRHPLELPR